MANFNWPSSSASVTISAIGTNGATAPTSSIEVGGIGVDGNLHGLSTDNSGQANVNVVNVPAVSQSGAWNITNVSGTVSLPTGASTSALQSTGNTSVASIDTKTPALGQALAAASVPVVLTAAQIATLTPLTAVTANAGTNLNTSALALDTSVNTLLKPASTLAAVTAITNTVTIKADTAGNQANALKVDGSAVTQPVSGTLTVNQGTSATGTITSVASSATTVTVLASNASRKNAAVYNESTQVLYLKLGATASLTSYTVQIPASGYYELPNDKTYTGVIDGLWASANGSARVTELT